jgi:CheY-like chemotaxis protein
MSSAQRVLRQMEAPVARRRQPTPMPPELTSAAADRDNLSPEPSPEPDPAPSGAGGRLLERVKDVARAIADRVRRALLPGDQPTDDELRPPNLRVLVVDDNPDAADSLAAVLELLGFAVRTCYSGPSALAAAEAFAPDACLIDLAMPGMSGLELAGEFRARAGSRPLLLVATTALGAVEDRTRTALAGFHYHLVKPVETPELFAALSRFEAMIGRPPPDPGPPPGLAGVT